MLNTNKDLKLYFSIREVAELLGVTETLLRFWEREFPSIHPKKAGRGIRQYTKEDIEAVRTVYHYVKECKMTLDGARDAIKRDKGQPNKKLEIIERLKFVSKELQAIGKEMGGLQ